MSAGPCIERSGARRKRGKRGAAATAGRVTGLQPPTTSAAPLAMSMHYGAAPTRAPAPTRADAAPAGTGYGRGKG